MKLLVSTSFTITLKTFVVVDNPIDNVAVSVTVSSPSPIAGLVTRPLLLI